MSDFTEPGRHVEVDGRIVYAWPPEGRFADLWLRFVAAFPDDVERCEVETLVRKWVDESSTLCSYTDEDGRWVDVTPDWDIPEGWGS